MIEEIKTDNNCIVKAFENNPISILHEDINNKKVYYFKASDVGNALGIVNIRTTIQNYEDDDERVVRKVYDPHGTLQDTIFLTSQGVYRLLYNSKKEIAKKFRKWAGNILDDIIFNESKELQKQLENQKLLLENKDLEKKREVEMTLRNSFNKRNLVYLIKITIDNEIIYKFGHTDDIVTRLRAHKNQICEDIELVYCIESKDRKMLERLLIDYLEQYKFRIRRIINDKHQTELLKVNDIEIIKNKLIELNKDLENEKLLIIKLKNKIIDLENENIELKQQLLLKDDEIVNELKNKIEMLERSILDYKLGDGDKIKPFIENRDTVEDRIYKKRKVDKIDCTTLQIIETYESMNAVVIKNPEFSYNQIYRSIIKNNVYKNFRWNYHGEKINPTNKITMDGNKVERVVQLDKDKNFVKIYKTKSELCKLLHTGIIRLNKYIDEGKLLNNFYYVTESCYNGEISDNNNYEIHNSKQIKETNIETNEIIIYQTMKELYEKRGISRETLRNCIKNNRVCDKYKWEYVNDNDNKNNSKQIKEINVRTNTFIIYSSMKKIYSKLNTSIHKFKTIINNKDIINDCIYEFC